MLRKRERGKKGRTGRTGPKERWLNTVIENNNRTAGMCKGDVEDRDK